MQTRIRRGLLGALFAGALLALGTTAASASEPLNGPPDTAKTSGDHSITSGNQVTAPVTAPVTAAAVTAAVLGDSLAINTDGNHKGGDKGPTAGPRIDAVTSGDHSITSGNKVTAPVTPPVAAPVTVVAVTSTAILDDSAAINAEGNHKGSSAGPRVDAVTSGDRSIDSGNEVTAPAIAPVTVAVTSTAVPDDSTAINFEGNHNGGDKGSTAGPRIDAITPGDHSITSGNQVTGPVTAAAVTAAVLDDSTAINTDGNHTDGNHKGVNHKGGDKGSSAGLRINAVTSGDHRIASGNKVTAPVTLAAFSTAVLGDSTASNKDGGNHNGGDCKDVDKGSSAGPRIAAVASVDHSIASGNHLIAPVAPPITEGAVSAAVLGDSSVINKDGTCTDQDKGPSAGPRIGPATSDDHSIASGNPQWLLPAGLVLMLAGLLLMLVKRQEQ